MLTPDQFWALTVPEFNALVRGHQARERSRYEHELWAAWHAAALGRQKRLPPLKQLLSPGQTKRLTPAEREVRRREFEELSKRMAPKKPEHPSEKEPRD